MKQDEIFTHEDFKRCADFHGHICPGLSIGYRAAKAGLDWLNEHRATDEEIVAIVETDACGADAVQVISGCTFGKGNFIFMEPSKPCNSCGEPTMPAKMIAKGDQLICRDCWEAGR